LKWTQIRDFCEQIEQQLTTPSEVIAPPTAAIRPEKKSVFVWVVAVLFVAVIAGVFLFPKNKKRFSSAAPKAGWVKIEAGKHDTPDGMREKVPDFTIAACEVTIGDYAGFLETLDILAKDGGQTTFDHPEQPKTKTGHTPDDWENLYLAAKEGGEWGGREINIHTPVVGVDWWDAFAYAKWKKSCLPTQEHWLGALMTGAKVPSQVPVSDLLPVNEETEDLTTNGLLGMAGSVSEWTGEARPSPSNPLGEPLWVIIGGSYLNPGKGALTREWVADRMTRRPDLGFRICKEAGKN
jgi:formylglycine-generating enzyme required for sulfatase activity